MRTPDSDDHLAAYFRQLAEHELLTPEDERELSQGIEDTEILTWERVFARAGRRASAARARRAEPRAAGEVPEAAQGRRRHAQDQARAQGRASSSRSSRAAAKEAALQLRALDLDRVHIDAVVRELYRAREAALAGDGDVVDRGRARKDAGAYVDEVRQALSRRGEPARRVRAREPAPRRHDGAPLRPRRHAARRSDPGGQPRPDARGVALRLPPRPAVLDLRVLVDPPRDRSRARRQGARGPHPGAHARGAAAAREGAPGAGRRARSPADAAGAGQGRAGAAREAQPDASLHHGPADVARPAGPRRRRSQLRRHDGRSGQRGALAGGQPDDADADDRRSSGSCTTCRRSRPTC